MIWGDKQKFQQSLNLCVWCMCVSVCLGAIVKMVVVTNEAPPRGGKKERRKHHVD